MYLVKTIKEGRECPLGIKCNNFSEAFIEKTRLENINAENNEYEYKIIEA